MKMKLSNKDKYSFKEWEDILDPLCKEVVALRDNFRCRKCGKQMIPSDKTGQMIGCDWSHVYSRANKNIKWDPDNSMIHCGGCHIWWGQCPLEGAKWYREEFGDKQADALILRKNTSHGKIDCNAIYLYLKSEKQRLTKLRRDEVRRVGDLS